MRTKLHVNASLPIDRLIISYNNTEYIIVQKSVFFIFISHITENKWRY